MDFLLAAGQLKAQPRSGWLRFGINAESVADHSWRCALAAVLLEPASSLESPGCARSMVGLVHDLAEALVGDITPHDGVSPEDKHRLEAEALASLLAPLGDSPAARAIAGWYGAYESGAAPDLKDIDKLEMMLQAYTYEGADPSLDLSQFYVLKKPLRNPVIQGWYDELMARREARGVARKKAAGASKGGAVGAATSSWLASPSAPAFFAGAALGAAVALAATALFSRRRW